MLHFSVPHSLLFLQSSLTLYNLILFWHQFISVFFTLHLAAPDRRQDFWWEAALHFNWKWKHFCLKTKIFILWQWHGMTWALKSHVMFRLSGSEQSCLCQPNSGTVWGQHTHVWGDVLQKAISEKAGHGDPPGCKDKGYRCFRKHRNAWGWSWRTWSQWSTKSFPA